MPIDHVLKLYSESVRSPYLHYGFWDDPKSVTAENLSLHDIVAAQDRYIEHLTSFIPEDVKTILDVGAGIGGNSSYLLNKGCYIQIQPGWKTARKTVRDGGYLLASDYFLHHNDGSGDWHIKASHNEKVYMEIGEEYGFKLLREYDQTENTMPTLDSAKAFMERYIYPTVEFSSNYMDKNYSFIMKILKKAFGKRVNEKMKQLSLLDSNEFRKYKRYMIFLFQKVS